MDHLFTAEELAFRNEVRGFLREALPERLREGERCGTTAVVEPEIGLEWQRILHEKGWFAYCWPREFGGTGWSPVERYIFEKECALADAPPLPTLGLKLLGPVIYTYGTDDQKARYLPKILSGEHYWCQGFSEPDAGSDLANLKTRAVRKGERYMVNGSKLWTTHAHHANRIFCLVRTDTAVKPQAGISFLLLDMEQPGITVSPIRSFSGDHEVNQVFFDDAVAPIEDLIGSEGQGWAIAKFLLEHERGGSCYAPKILVDLERLRRFAVTEPSGYNGRRGGSAAFQMKLTGLLLEAQALEFTELRILGEISQGRSPGPQTSLVKMIASGLRQATDKLAVQLFGYAGLQLPQERPLFGVTAPEPIGSKNAQVAAPRYLNSRACSIFGGSREIQKTIIARTVLGLQTANRS